MSRLEILRKMYCKLTAREFSTMYLEACASKNRELQEVLLDIPGTADFSINDLRHRLIYLHIAFKAIFIGLLKEAANPYTFSWISEEQELLAWMLALRELDRQRGTGCCASANLVCAGWPDECLKLYDAGEYGEIDFSEQLALLRSGWDAFAENTCTVD